ncbi:hypothetical protein [Pedobacter heparinus]|uniref:hypothetical protein n=1 Tax=Pedobacter heparinus TaxID=984 RepID=UPI002930CBAC|nr:hypothetical protein [Pedobacter heparinus]
MKKCYTILVITLVLPMFIVGQTRNDAGLQGDAGATSGFFEANAPVNYPAGATGWWHLLDVRHSNPSNNFAMQFSGGFYDQELHFRKTSNSASQPWSKVLLETAGKVGIGINNPQSKLHIYQSLPDQSAMIVQGNTINPDNAQHYVAITLDGDYGNGTGNYSQIRSYSNLHNYWGSRLAFFTTSSSAANTLLERMRIDADGNVGIGTDDPKGYRLAVNGKIRAQEIKVEASPWPDYVFTKDYQLLSLQQTEQHIKEKGHLPGIPSAAEAKSNGIDLGEMNAKLLQKIEELTLHLIEKDKETRVLKNENKDIRLKLDEIILMLNNKTIN